MFQARFYLFSKNLNRKDTVNNFVGLLGESGSRSWDKFTAYVRGVPEYRIDDMSLKEYFYRRQNNNNNKVVLDTIADGSYGECTSTEIAEKIEKISRNNKACITRKLNTGRNTSAVQATHCPTTYEIPEELSQMKTKLGLVNMSLEVERKLMR